MYTITKKQWEEIAYKHPDYAGVAIRKHQSNGKICNIGDKACFEYLLPGAPNTGATLVFEHIHFEIV